jgi:polyhydroxyalkanoate synthesis repressor PhaR
MASIKWKPEQSQPSKPLQTIPPTFYHFRKYPNRRLYDMQRHCYVMFSDVARAVCEHKPIHIVESKTGRDVTRAVLFQVFCQQESERENNGTPVVLAIPRLIQLINQMAPARILGSYP